ncbi:hypothetical protein BH23ACT11_BH23ACT11_17260 [soil metagenome]
MLFKENKSATAPLRPGESAPTFRLLSAQGGRFRLDMRIAQGPAVLAFVDPGEGGSRFAGVFKKHQAEFQSAGAYKYYRPNRENRTTARPHYSIGSTVTATVAAVVRAEAMKPVRELKEQLELPYYVLWEEAGRASE